MAELVEIDFKTRELSHFQTMCLCTSLDVLFEQPAYDHSQFLTLMNLVGNALDNDDVRALACLDNIPWVLMKPELVRTATKVIANCLKATEAKQPTVLKTQEG